MRMPLAWLVRLQLVTATISSSHGTHFMGSWPSTMSYA